VTKEIDSPIASVTPLQFIKGNPDTEWIFKEDLTPIFVEELPPSEFFFSKKRKAKDEANKGFEQARVTDQQEIERLKSDLENMHQSE
jgi:hypothetical protein